MDEENSGGGGVYGGNLHLSAHAAFAFNQVGIFLGAATFKQCSWWTVNYTHVFMDGVFGLQPKLEAKGGGIGREKNRKALSDDQVS